MRKIEKFEDLICWQKGRLIVKEIYIVTKKSDFAKDYDLKGQIRRAAISVILNIAEGFARRSRKEFKHFLYTSHGSLAEIQSALYISLDLEYITSSIFKNLYSMCEENSKIIMGLIKKLE